MNNDIDNVDILPLLDTGYALKTIANGQNAVFRNGRLVYIILDIDKPGKYFFDLRSVFNASTGEGGKNLNIMFMNNAVPYQLNGKTIGIDGAYPSGERFHVTGSQNQANSSLIEFNFPLGLFQEAGVYKFQFEIRDESGNLATSHYCFFQVTQNATLLAADFKNGVSPFDSDYTEWKNKVEQEINTLMNTLNNIKVASDQMQSLLNQYVQKVEAYAQNAWEKMLQQDNTWGGTQQFDKAQIKDFQADIVRANNFNGLNMDLTGNVTLENTPALKYVGNDLKRGLFAFEEYFYISTNPSNNAGGAIFVNGVQPGAGGQDYISIRTFRIGNADDKTSNIIIEMRANCNIPDSAIGKTIIQFPTSTHMFEGIDQTPFFLGNWVLQFSAADKSLRCQGKINSSGTNNLQDSKML